MLESYCKRVFLAAVLSAVASGSVLAAPAADGANWRVKVDPWLLEARRSEEPVEFMLLLDEQADTSAIAGIEDPLDRRRALVTLLRKTAKRTQAPILMDLKSHNLDHRSYWVTNAVWAKGETADLARLAGMDAVRRIEGNRGTGSNLPNGAPSSARGVGNVEWNVTKIRADEVWALGYNGQGAVIGGQDTGYEWTHAAIQSTYRGWDGVQADHNYNWHDSVHDLGSDCGFDTLEPCDDHNHGTHTMGTMTGDDGGTNRTGVAPGAQWIACRNMNEGNGTPATYAECFQWFIAPTDLDGNNPDPSKAPDVINNSWACPPIEGCAADTLKQVVANTRVAGIVVVGSAGNEGNSCGSVANPPAIYDATFSIGATDINDGIALFSSRGPVTVDGSNRLKPDVSAPGVNVRSSVRGGNYASFNGTSMAGPHVAATVALMIGANPSLRGRVDDIEEILRVTADPQITLQDCGGFSGLDTPNAVYGAGRIDAFEAVAGDPDLDGVGNQTDCSPLDALTWAQPGAVTTLRLDRAATGTELSWSNPAEPGGTGLGFDVLRGDDPATMNGVSCLADDQPATTIIDDADPFGLYFYLVRPRNGCGAAAGAGSSGEARATPSCS